MTAPVANNPRIIKPVQICNSRLQSDTATHIASSSAETTIVAAGATGIFRDLIGLVITNATATAVTVTIKDGTAGTTRLIINLAASGGIVLQLPVGFQILQTTAANTWTATLSSGAVTVDFFAMWQER